MIHIEISEVDLKKLIIDHIKTKLGDHFFDETKVTIEVKSKQNYKSEWESASFRASYKDHGSVI
jgi:hypothetical protein